MKSKSNYELNTNNAKFDEKSTTSKSYLEQPQTTLKFEQPRKASNILFPPNLRITSKNVCITDHNGINEISHELIRPCNLSGNEMSMKQPTKLKVRTERSAMMLGLIVLLFIFTHSYRIALKVYDVTSPNAHTMEKFKICYALRR
jgi:hypothetical protein